MHQYWEMFQGFASISLVLWLLNLRNLIMSSICQISKLKVSVHSIAIVRTPPPKKLMEMGGGGGGGGGLKIFEYLLEKQGKAKWGRLSRNGVGGSGGGGGVAIRLLRLTRKNMHIYQVTNTLSQSRNQLQNKNIHINFFIFSLQQVQLAHIFRLDNLEARNLGCCLLFIH